MSEVASLIAFCLAVPAATSVVPGLLYWLYRREAVEHWPPRQVGTEVVSGAKYREGAVPMFSQEGPSKNVLLAAIGCWGLGQMFVPGLLAGLFGLIVVVGVVSIPGLILAWKLFFLGKPLLRGEREAADKARGLASFANGLNALVVVVTGLLAMYTLLSSRRGDWLNVLLLALPVLLYAAISLAHARFLHKAADEIDEKFRALDAQFETNVRVDAGSFAASAVDGSHLEDSYASADVQRAKG